MAPDKRLVIGDRYADRGPGSVAPEVLRERASGSGVPAHCRAETSGCLLGCALLTASIVLVMILVALVATAVRT